MWLLHITWICYFITGFFLYIDTMYLNPLTPGEYDLMTSDVILIVSLNRCVNTFIHSRCDENKKVKNGISNKHWFVLYSLFNIFTRCKSSSSKSRPDVETLWQKLPRHRSDGRQTPDCTRCTCGAKCFTRAEWHELQLTTDASIWGVWINL